MFHASFFPSLARRFLTRFAPLAATTAALFGQLPSANDGFDPNVDGNVLAVATQADGRVVIGGQFSTVMPNGATVSVSRVNAARLNPDGSVDGSFDPKPNGPVRAIVVLPDGGILIGGDFTTVQPAGSATPVARNRLARFTAAGVLDTAFSAGVSGSLLPQVYALALQANGSVVVGGSFSTAQGSGAAAGSTRNNLARFSGTGALEAYDPNPNGLVLALAVHTGGKIVVGGGFTTWKPNGATAAITRNRLARLNTDGSIDEPFNPNVNNGVTTVAVQRDGKIVFGGYFTTVQPPEWLNAIPRSRLARLNADGSLDADFFPNAGGNVSAVAVQPDGGIVIGGPFGSVWGRGSTTISRNNIARFAPDGSVDANFGSGVNAEVSAIAVQADGKLILGGLFTRAFPIAAVASIVRNHVVRLTANGAVDANFQLEAGGRPLVSVVQADGRVILGGSFTTVGGATHNYLARTAADGSVDATYNPSFDNRILALALQSDGRLLVGGTFSTVNGQTRNRLARLNGDGTLDAAFNPNVDGSIASVLVQSDGKIVIGGAFTSLTPNGATTITARYNMARLNSDGTLDTAFNPTPSNSISAMVLQSDGKIVIGGLFTTLQPGATGSQTARAHMARLNADGTVDGAFNPSFNGQVSAIALQADGKFVVGGVFTQLAPNGATTATTRNRLARLAADGTVDTTFDPNANGNVLTVAVQADGKILAGGTFTTFTPKGAADWTLRKYAARLNSDGTVDAAFNLDLNEVNGNRVDSLRVLADGRILIGGSFTSLQPIGATTRVLRKNFARLTATGAVDPTFDLGAGGSTGAVVNAIALQSDGKVIAAGVFSDLGGARSTNLARFTPEGSADTTFGSTVTTDGAINAVAVRPNGAPASPQMNGFAWFNSNGTLRTSFVPGSNTRLSGRIRVVAFQADGSLIVGGAFTNLTNFSNGNLLRFRADGTLDNFFSPLVNGEVNAIAVQADGKILIAGSFTLINSTARNRIARLNSDGTLDGSYDPNVSAGINTLVLQADGKALIGGAFSTLTPNGATTAVNRNYLARLNTDGTLDTAFNPSPNVNVNALAVQPDGKIVVGGAFTSFTPNASSTAVTRNFLGRLNADGTLDTTFDPNLNSAVNAIALQSNGDLVLGGAFTSLEPTVNGAKVQGAARAYLARLRTNGDVDRGFNPTANATVNQIALQSDGAILVAGDFTTLRPGNSGAEISRNRLARLNTDGSLDVSFNPNVTGLVYGVTARADGSVVVGGEFTGVQGTGAMLVGGSFANIGGLPASNLALLNDDGSINSSFLPLPNGAVNAILPLPDGRFLIGGAFTTIGGATRNRLARFNANGALDPAFNPNLNNTVNVLALQADGRILVGGSFTTVGNTARANLARLNTDGTLDGTFTAATSAVSALAAYGTQIVAVVDAGASQKTLVRFNANGAADPGFTPTTGALASLVVQVDGRVVVGGAFQNLAGSNVSRLARFNSNGTLDASFNPGPNGAVTALALQSDGRLMLGGGFTRIGALERVGVARLSVTDAGEHQVAVGPDRTSLLYLLGNSAGQASAVLFERSTDLTTWTTLGAGTRTVSAGVWQLNGVTLAPSGNFYIRARATSPSSSGTSAGGYEATREFNLTAAALNTPPAGSTQPSQGGRPFFIDPFTGLATGTIPRTGVAGVDGAENPGEPQALIPNFAVGEPGSAWLADISTRGRVSADSPLIIGFAIGSGSSQTVLLRAVGPSLAKFGVEGVVAEPLLRLYDAQGKLLLENSSWLTSPGVATVAAQSGAFPFDAASTKDAAVVATLPPGAYTMHVLTSGNASGVALAEIYAANGGTKLVNLSSRGTAGTGGEAFIGGLVVAGSSGKNLLVRGVGPTLARFGVANSLNDPVVSVYDSQNRLVASNDNWSSVAAGGFLSVSTAQLVSAITATGAFGFDVGSADAAVLVTLVPGSYTIQVSGVAGTTGAAMIEVYDR